MCADLSERQLPVRVTLGRRTSVYKHQQLVRVVFLHRFLQVNLSLVAVPLK